jgi:hypothetical protein
MTEEHQQKLLAVAEGSVKTLYALCKEGNESNADFIIEQMQRWLAALIEANLARRDIVDYFYSWQREVEGNDCIDEKLRQLFESNAELAGEHIHHSWIDSWIENG